LFEQLAIPAIDSLLPLNGTNLEDALNIHGLGIEKLEINLHKGYTELLLSPQFTVEKAHSEKLVKSV